LKAHNAKTPAGFPWAHLLIMLINWHMVVLSVNPLFSTMQLIRFDLPCRPLVRLQRCSGLMASPQTALGTASQHTIKSRTKSNPQSLKYASLARDHLAQPIHSHREPAKE
jgi:hypothetical protein